MNDFQIAHEVPNAAFIAQWLERWSSKPEAGSSILPEGTWWEFFL